MRRVQVKNIHTGRHNSYGNIESKLKSTLNFAAGVTDAGQSVSHHRAAAPTQKQTKMKPQQFILDKFHKNCVSFFYLGVFKVINMRANLFVQTLI